MGRLPRSNPGEILVGRHDAGDPLKPVRTRLAVAAFIAVLLPLCAAAQSQKQKDAATQQAAQDAAAQHLRDLATIDQLVKENAAAVLATKNTVSNGAAIAKLSGENKARAAVATVQNDVHAEAAQRAVGAVQDAAVATQATVEKITPKIDSVVSKVDIVAAKVAAIAPPIDYRPVMIVAIPVIGTMFAGVVSIIIVVLNRVKAVATKTDVIADRTTEISGRVDGVIAKLQAAAFKEGREASDADHAQQRAG